MRYKLFRVFLLYELVVMCKIDAWSHDLFLRLEEDTRGFLYDSTRRYVIDTLQHDFANENYIVLEVDTCVRGMIYVKPVWSLGPEYLKKGWIDLSDNNVTIYPFKYEGELLPLYDDPSYFSHADTIKLISNEEVMVMNYDNGWVYTVVEDTIGVKHEGWLAPTDQCSNAYSTCHRIIWR